MNGTLNCLYQLGFHSFSRFAPFVVIIIVVVAAAVVLTGS